MLNLKHFQEWIKHSDLPREVSVSVSVTNSTDSRLSAAPNSPALHCSLNPPGSRAMGTSVCPYLFDSLILVRNHNPTVLQPLCQSLLWSNYSLLLLPFSSCSASDEPVSTSPGSLCPNVLTCHVLPKSYSLWCPHSFISHLNAPMFPKTFLLLLLNPRKVSLSLLKDDSTFEILIPAPPHLLFCCSCPIKIPFRLLVSHFSGSTCQLKNFSKTFLPKPKLKKQNKSVIAIPASPKELTWWPFS